MKWKDLNMAQKSELMSLFIKNGISSLSGMESFFNTFSEGGSVEDPPEKSDWAKSHEAEIALRQLGYNDSRNALHSDYAVKDENGYYAGYKLKPVTIKAEHPIRQWDKTISLDSPYLKDLYQQYLNREEAGKNYMKRTAPLAMSPIALMAGPTLLSKAFNTLKGTVSSYAVPMANAVMGPAGEKALDFIKFIPKNEYVGLKNISRMHMGKNYPGVSRKTFEDGGPIGRRGNYTPPSLFVTSNISVGDNTRYVRPYDSFQIAEAKKKYEKEQTQKAIIEAQRRQPQLKADTRSERQRQIDHNRAVQQEVKRKANEQAAIFGRALGSNHDMTIDEVNANTLDAANMAGWLINPIGMTVGEGAVLLNQGKPKDAALTAAMTLFPMKLPKFGKTGARYSKELQESIKALQEERAAKAATEVLEMPVGLSHVINEENLRKTILNYDGKAAAPSLAMARFNPKTGLISSNVMYARKGTPISLYFESPGNSSDWLYFAEDAMWPTYKHVFKRYPEIKNLEDILAAKIDIFRRNMEGENPLFGKPVNYKDALDYARKAEGAYAEIVPKYVFDLGTAKYAITKSQDPLILQWFKDKGISTDLNAFNTDSSIHFSKGGKLD